MNARIVALEHLLLEKQLRARKDLTDGRQFCEYAGGLARRFINGSAAIAGSLRLREKRRSSEEKNI